MHPKGGMHGVSSEEEQRFEVRAGLVFAWKGKALTVGCAAVCVGWVSGRRFPGNTPQKGGTHGMSLDEGQRFEVRAGLMLAWRGPVRAPCSECLVYPPYGPRCLVRQKPTCHTSPTPAASQVISKFLNETEAYLEKLANKVAMVKVSSASSDRTALWMGDERAQGD